jgi:hypothetical protein
MFRSSVRASAFALAVCLLLAGCSKSNVVPVSGTLTYKGQPVTNAYVNFVPENGRPSMGETDQNGRFTLVYDPQTKGAQLGKHRVFVTHNAAADASQPGTIPGEPPKLSPESKELFSKYSGEKSKVEIVIEKATPDLKLDWD